MSGYSTLEVYDFDWTLFRSPFPPEGKSDKSWWASEESLMPPHVPLRAPRSFWIEEVVKEMLSSQKRWKSTLTIVLTARRGKTEARIRELLGQRYLVPDYLIGRPASFQKEKSSELFKRKTVANILDSHPGIKKVVVWEDMQKQLDGIGDLLKRRGIDFEPNLVTDPEHRRKARKK